MAFTIDSDLEHLNVHMWSWEDRINPEAHDLKISEDSLQVHFHTGFSSGTAVVKGNTPLIAGYDHYWQIKILTQLYGTDVMVGVGTDQTNLSLGEEKFCSLLGQDKESWGFSYNGLLQHNGDWVMKKQSQHFNKGDVVGVHLDMWNGLLNFYLNGQIIDHPYKINLQNIKVLYPMISSTAAYSSLKLIYSYSCQSSLQQFAMRSLRNNSFLLKEIFSIPHLKREANKIFLSFQSVERTNHELDYELGKRKTGVDKLVQLSDSDDDSVLYHHLTTSNFTKRYRPRRRKNVRKTSAPFKDNIIDKNNGSSSIVHVEPACLTCGASFPPSTHEIRIKPEDRLCNNCSVIF